jgi:nucleoside-diphosphate-sugar epimerase
VATVVIGVGYIGSRLVQELLFQGRDVVALDNYFSTDRRAIELLGRSADFRFVEGSVSDEEAIARALRGAGNVDAVYLLAAQASAHPDAATPGYTEQTNLSGPRLVLEALARLAQPPPLVYASSLRVYGAPLAERVDEDTPYGRFGDLSHLSKIYVEKLLEMYAETSGVTSRAVRLGLTYGVAPVMKTDRRFMTAPNLFCWQAAVGEELQVRTADWLGLIHVEDAARALIWAAEGIPTPGYLAVNAAPEVETLGTIARLVQTGARDRAIESRVSELAGPTSASRPRISSRLSAAGFTPVRRLGADLVEVLDHYRVRGR